MYAKDIEFEDTTSYTPFGTNECYYEVKNGVCYVQLCINISNSSSTEITICSTMPKSKRTVRSDIICAGGNPVSVVLLNTGVLKFKGGTVRNYNTCSFSYPVAE